jgi:hypothetical protein
MTRQYPVTPNGQEELLEVVWSWRVTGNCLVIGVTGNCLVMESYWKLSGHRELLEVVW